jgi:hypothetical protein
MYRSRGAGSGQRAKLRCRVRHYAKRGDKDSKSPTRLDFAEVTE